MKCLYQIAEHDVHQFIMPVITSNMYVLIAGEEALVIDPNISAEAETLLAEAGVKSCTVLLTHEHYDHISGVNRLRQLYSCRVICTKACAERIQNPRKSCASSFSVLFLSHDSADRKTIEGLIDTEYSCFADESYSDYMELLWHGIRICLKELHGHSPGSQIIHLDDIYVFTGDNLNPNLETITRLPGGSKKSYEEEVVPYLRNLREDSLIFPGHGTPVPFSSIPI